MVNKLGLLLYYYCTITVLLLYYYLQTRPMVNKLGLYSKEEVREIVRAKWEELSGELLRKVIIMFSFPYCTLPSRTIPSLPPITPPPTKLTPPPD
jgi:hypothetical protein